VRSIALGEIDRVTEASLRGCSTLGMDGRRCGDRCCGFYPFSMARLRVPGCRSKFEPVLSDDWPTWHVNAPPFGPGQAHEWWFAKRGVELLIVHDRASDINERNVFIYGPPLRRRWMVLAFADAIPEWAGQLPDLLVWQGQQWIQDRKTGIVVARRHDPITLANEQWVLGPDGPERVPLAR
jgi:hypothetical protein